MAANASTHLRPCKNDLAMRLAMKRRTVRPRTEMSSIDKEIRDFLAGKGDGNDLLHALYDYVLDEPVPQRLRTLLEH
jgi:hypothetical protein